MTGKVLRKVLRITKFRNYPDMYKKYEMKGFNTPSGKVEIWSERLKSLGGDPLPVYTEPAESPVSRPDLVGQYPLIRIDPDADTDPDTDLPWSSVPVSASKRRM